MKQRQLMAMSLSIMLILVFAVGAGTFALFTDSDTNSDNHFTAGTINLDAKRDHGDYTPGPMFYTDYLDPAGKHPYDKGEVAPSGEVIGGWAPGDSVQRTMILTNTGTLDARITGIKATPQSTYTQHLPTGGSRTVNGLTTGAAYEEFIQKANVLVSIPDLDLKLYEGPLSGLILPDGAYADTLNQPVLMGTLPPFQPGPLNVTFKVTLDRSASNEIQEKTFIFGFGFYVEQDRNNDGSIQEDGTVNGQLVDALTGNPIPNQTIEFTPVNNISSFSMMAANDVASNNVYSITTDANGYFNITLPSGTYNIIIVGGHYISPGQIEVLPGQIITPFWPVSPVLGEGETRIVLSWGEVPTDLDSHLTGPISPNSSDRFHVYYSNTHYNDGLIRASLDRDDTNSFGPETITISNQMSGVYRYSIHNYTNRGDNPNSVMASSGAKVQVFRGDNLVATFNVPNEPGTLWTVFELNGDTITPINHMSYEYYPFNIQSLSQVITDGELLLDLPDKN